MLKLQCKKYDCVSNKFDVISLDHLSKNFFMYLPTFLFFFLYLALVETDSAKLFFLYGKMRAY